MEWALAELTSLYPRWNSERANASGRDSWHRIDDTATGVSVLLGGCSVDLAAVPNVTHVLSIVSLRRGQKPVQCIADSQPVTLVIDLDDDFDATLHLALPAALQFLDAAASAGGVCYVHCELGRSRSASVVIAWLMSVRATRGLSPSLLQCWALVASRRRISALNYGFLCRLCDHEASLGGETATLSLLTYFLMQMHDSSQFAYKPPTALELAAEAAVCEEETSAAEMTNRQRALRELLASTL